MIVSSIKKSQAGNVLFIILIAVALFAALSYAITNDRTTAKDSSGEQQKLDQAVVDNYMSCINSGRMTLEIARGCTNINYDPPSEWSGSNFKCHMFHPQGGGCSYQDLGLNGCDVSGNKEDLAIGESCGGLIYAGESGGNRIYTTPTDQGTMSWNNATSNWTVTGTTSASDGVQNTDMLIELSDAGAPYQAAISCRALGADWYLPARNELTVLYTNKNTGSLDGTFNESGVEYWSSTEYNNSGAYVRNFNTGNEPAQPKHQINRYVRCVRRD